MLKLMQDFAMRTTVTIDDDLFERAVALSDAGLEKPSDIFKEAMTTFVRVQSARRLAALGGAAPDMADIPRRSAPA
ncbi:MULTISPECIES: type II toxin-antitoxin system VapB family antitoxin [Paracoccus]|nr:MULTISPECIES: type II toxin-antitoxin system VapB family antitoxin [Paracoccus]